MSETVNQVVVHHANGLHVRIYHRRSDEAEPAALEIAAEGIRLGGRARNLTHRVPSVLPWATIDELPTVRVEAPVFLLHRQKRSRILHGGSNLHPIADDLLVGSQPFHPSR